MLEKKIDTAQGTVFYWISESWAAENETLVFLHGLTGDHTMFQPQIDEFGGEYNLLA